MRPYNNTATIVEKLFLKQVNFPSSSDETSFITQNEDGDDDVKDLVSMKVTLMWVMVKLKKRRL